MSISKLVAVVAFSAALATLSACTSGGEKGNPTPAPTSDGSSGNDSSASKLPERPTSLAVSSVDPCKLLTEAQMKQVDTISTRPVNLELVDGAESPSCHYSNEGRFTYTVGMVTHKGVDYWFQGGGNVTVNVIKIADYGAAKIELSGGSGFDCSIAIDVADGQQLMVSYIPKTTDEKDQAVLCGKAEKAAGLALATLKTLK
ncbi:DUF3558 domain-containing protein [Lentzea californiensis]|uniref:DUF3558 domain-containing protein n=1 Tax=Lentzea californiensis TaxID=438851 RepID=UPI002164AF38|nr:DUF3558 domain-containing protein [Lentzea californiensis]MCR3746805.1 Protein of unknown function (DUF3558) [Lentzea californiensis]